VARSGGSRSRSPACVSTTRQRQPRRQRESASATSTSSSPASPAAASRRLLEADPADPQPRAIVPTHYDNFFRPLGQELEFVANVQLAELPAEIGAVSADFEIAALPRADLAT